MRIAAVVAGLLCVLVGAADLTTRLSHITLGDDATSVAFAPAVTLLPTSTSQGALVPAKLSIPVLGVSAGVEQVGKKADGSMGTPQNFNDVAWYSLGSQPGAPGNAVFAGHVNNARTTAGVFANLSKLKVGDYITVADAAGKTKVFKVSDVQEVAADAPTDTIFATTGPSQLVLITCDGEWVSADHMFNKRLVVFAKPTV